MSSNDEFDEIAERLEAERRARVQELRARARQLRPEIEAAIRQENRGNPEEIRRLLEMLDNLDEQ